VQKATSCSRGSHAGPGSSSCRTVRPSPRQAGGSSGQVACTSSSHDRHVDSVSGVGGANQLAANQSLVCALSHGRPSTDTAVWSGGSAGTTTAHDGEAQTGQGFGTTPI
jgi:hypothetical protein